MHKRISGHLTSLFWALSILVVVGILVGELAWVLVAGLFAYLCWTITQSIRLHRWLYRTQGDENIPESHGLWGDLFDGLYQIQYQNKLTQEHLKSMVERIQMSTNALKEAVVMTNSEGAMDWWNDAACSLLGFKRASDRGQLITNLLRDPSFKKYFGNKHYNEPLELASPMKTGAMLQVHITIFGQEDRLVFIHDITRVHRLEQMRRDFVSNVSHDMRTPLTVLHGYIETFQDADDVPKKWRRALNSMEDQTKRMETLISDLLLLAKYETDDISQDTQRVSVDALLVSIKEDAIAFSGDRQHKIELEFETTGKCFLIGSERQLHSAFSNIVYNAVKYTPTKGSILLRWWVDEMGGHFSVEDTGQGFDAVHIPHLTERFYRTDPSRDNSSGGSGLGLAIVKHVLLNHEAELEIQSEVGVGSEFICHFPSNFVIEEEMSKQLANA